jgi:exodeoxyribonuclease VII large subunit
MRISDDLVFSPSEFVAALNQAIEFSLPVVVVEGEITDFRISKNQWVYFNLQDEEASVKFFGTVYMLPGPLEDGMVVRVVGMPKLHPRFGFSITYQSIQPVGEGSIKKAADLLFKKLEKEGLFLAERKRPLPQMPENIGLITASTSAAAADFEKILNERWGGMEVQLHDVLVQGERAPDQIVKAIENFNTHSTKAEILVITRGGGSIEDLAAFSDERVVRAVAASRIPTLVAIGHEVDVSLAELAADQRASTPSNAVQILVPDKTQLMANLRAVKINIYNQTLSISNTYLTEVINQKTWLDKHVKDIFAKESDRLSSLKQIIKIFDPKEALKRGYALIEKDDIHLKSVKKLSVGDNLKIRLSDGTIQAITKEININGRA